MFEQLTKHCYVRPFECYSDRPNIGLIRGAERAVLFDGASSVAHAEVIKQELREAGLPYPEYIALSHWHWDHTFGAHAWHSDVVACRMTNEQLHRMRAWRWDDEAMQERVENGTDIAFCTEMIKREYPDRKIWVPVANVVFDNRLTLDLGGGVVCELIRIGGPHSEDSVIGYIPSDRFVFLSDSANKDLYGQPWHFDIEHEEAFEEVVDALPYDPQRVKEYLDVLDTLDFTHGISGHGKMKTRSEIYDTFR